ncbi:MAG: abortive phage resistance protein [Lachnospiraceae bacterium]|nr:abortive phage resistance protein [Lachnospiraceae bacterium]
MAKNLSNNQTLLKEIIRQDFEESEIYDDENSFFEFFAASQVLKNNDLSDEEIYSGIVGGGHDGGCDGLYLFLNNDLITEDQLEGLTAYKGSELNFTIIQAKNTTGFKEDAIMKWKTVSDNLLDMSNDIEKYFENNRYSEQVVGMFTLFRDTITKLIRSQIKVFINYYYVTLGLEVNQNVEEQAAELKKVVNELYPSAKVAVNFINADKLMELYNADMETVINLKFSENPISRGKNAEYISLINLGTYYNFITDENGKLRSSFFESNVRDYQGKNSVNSSIADSLRDSSDEDFWWLNNGITILADKIVPIRINELEITNPEIVNGLQTSTEIYNFYSNNRNLIDNEQRNVLVRVIVPSSEEARDDIIFATNNQTNIPKSSLRVTDPIHLQIEMYMKSRGLYYDRRKNYYKNQKKKATDIVGVSFLAQCLISVFLKKPDFARARPSTLLTDDETYNKLYDSNTDLDVYYKTALLGKKIQANLSRTTDMTSAEKNDILYYLLYAVSAKMFNKKKIVFSDMKNIDVDAISEEVINTLKDQIYSKYKELGGNGRVAKSETFIMEIDKILSQCK